MTPAEHGQERVWTISRFRKPNTTWVEVLGDIEPPPWALESEQVEVVPAADKRALVEAGNNVISDLERQGSVTSAHYNALRAALYRIQEGESPIEPGYDTLSEDLGR